MLKLSVVRNANSDRYYRNSGNGLRFLAAAIVAVSSMFALQDAAEAANWYVSKLSTGTVHDGKSWATAWTDFGGDTPESRIDWSQVNQFDNIYVDAGATSATVKYTTPLVVQKSYVYVSIPANDAAHNRGLVLLETPSGTAIDLKTHAVQGVTVQGSRWIPTSFHLGPTSIQSMKYAPNFRVSTTRRGTGVAVGPNANQVVLRNLHLMDNSLGVDLSGGLTRAYYLMINQNDYNIRSAPTAAAVNQSAYFYYTWLFNANSDSMTTNVYCVSDPASNFELRFYYSILGPGFSNAIYSTRAADKVGCPYTLFMQNYLDMMCQQPPRAANMAYSIIFKTRLNRWNMANSNLQFTKGPGTSILGTIVHGGLVNVSGSGLLGPYNKQFNTSGNTLVLSPSQEDPIFKSNVSNLGNRPSFYTMTTLDFTPTNGTPGTAYTMHSVEELYSKVTK